MSGSPVLVTRKCACACGLTFRVLASSKHRFASAACEDLADVGFKGKDRDLARMVTVSDMALDLRVHPEDARSWIRKYKIPHRKLGQCIVVDPIKTRAAFLKAKADQERRRYKKGYAA